MRELENAVEFMVNMMGEDGILDESTLPGDLWEETEEEKGAASCGDGQTEDVPEREDEIVPLKELERREIEKAVEICGATTEGKKAAAARLGISVATLYRKLEQFSQTETRTDFSK